MASSQPASAQITGRAREPVVIRATNDLFPDFVDDGLAASSFELWTYRQGTWTIVPSQVDEVSLSPERVQDLEPAAQVCRTVGTTFRDASLALNEQRTYYATVLGNDGSEGPLSQGVVLLHDDTTAPDSPAGAWATATTGQIHLNWTLPSSPDVERVKVYASTTAGGPYNLVDSGANSHCEKARTINATAGTYYLVVKAVDFAGNTSAASNEVEVTVP